MNFGHQPRIVGISAVGVKVRSDPLAKIERFANIERLPGCAHECVDPGRFGKLVERARRKVRWRGGLLEQLGNRLIDMLDGFLLPEPVEKSDQHSRIAQCTMAIACLQLMPADQGVEPMRIVLGKQRARKSNRTQHIGAETVVAAPELGLDEAVVEAGIMGHEDASLEQPGDGRQELRKARGVSHHLIGDAGERLNIGWNGNAWVDKG